MTTPEDPTSKDAAPAPARKKSAAKPAAKKATPLEGTTAQKTTAAKPEASGTKPGAKKVTPVDPAPAAPAAKKTTRAKAPAKNAPPVASSTAPGASPLVQQAPAKPPTQVVAPQTAAPEAGRASTHAAKTLKRAAKVPEKRDFVATIKQKSAIYWRLMRMDRPIGTLLLLWPTLWSLWIAAKGVPSIQNLVIFVLGVIVMRAAGCVINDFADRKIDGRVERTKDRPLATGAVSSREALGLFVALCLIAFTLVLFTDPFTIKLSVGGLILAFCYPFMKRHTHLPQVVLGAAFAWGIPMAYAAEAGGLHEGVWLIYVAVVLWTVAYDTFYAMVDRDDDLKIGVKSTAILFGEQDRLMTGVLQIMALYALMLVGNRFELGTFYYLGLAVAAGLFGYQQWLIRFRARAACFKAFLNNNWVGVAVFVGILMDYSFR